MKNKKLLISLAVVAVVVVIVVVLSAVLTVQKVTVVYHSIDGTESLAPDDALNTSDILSTCKGKSIVVLSKTNFLAEFNRKYTEWHAFAVVRNYPNRLEIHVVRRTAIAKFRDANGKQVYIDMFGYATEPSTETVIDISSAFKSSPDLVKNNVGELIEFESEENNLHLSLVLESIIAKWMCYVDYEEMPQVLGEENVFTFEENGDLRIHIRLGGYILVQSPTVELIQSSLKDAYEVYNNTSMDLHRDECVITVHSNGKITTPEGN